MSPDREDRTASEEGHVLDYRRLDEAERRVLREQGQHARSLGCWTSVAVVVGVPVFSMFCFVVYLSIARDGSGGQIIASLVMPAFMLLAGAALARAAWRGFIAREFFAGLAQGLAGIAVMIAVAAIASFILTAFIS